MTNAEWRALIEAYLDGRISADAFARRFNEACLKMANARQTYPPAVNYLFGAVEQFGEQEGDDPNDDDMRQSAERALAQLQDEPAVAPHTFDRTRAREDMRRFQVQMRGCAGLGCLIAVAWVALCLLQIYFVSEWIQEAFEWGAWPSAVVGFFLAFVPIIGNVLAFLGATQEGWSPWLAGIVFFAAPAVTILSGWQRYRQFGPPRG
jgi:hypothetical protein